MEFRTLGRTGLSVSRLALGTVELGLDYGIPAPGGYGRPSAQAAQRLVHTALNAGINFIDTARAYGTSEAVLGQALQGRRTEVVLATKVSTQADGVTLRGEALRRALADGLDASLRALGTDYVDIWQIHNVDTDLLDQAEILAEAFAQARASGKIRWTGGSFYGAGLPLAGLATDLFDTVQVTYSALDQRLADRVLPAAAARGVGVVARSVLLQGVLTSRADHLPARLDPLRARSRQFRALLAAQPNPPTPAQAAIAFALAQPHIDAVLVGVRTRAELAENLAGLETRLPPPLLAELTRLRLDDPALLNPGNWRL